MLGTNIKFLTNIIASTVSIRLSPGFEVSLPLGFGDDITLHRPLADYIALLGRQPDPEDRFVSRIEKILKLRYFFVAEHTGIEDLPVSPEVLWDNISTVSG